VRQQDIGNIEIQFGRAPHDFIDLPGRIHDRASTAGAILDQVDEIFHGPQFHGVYFESRIWHVQFSEFDAGIIRVIGWIFV